MKKQTILNVIMICAIAVILISGLLFVGSVQGWFDHDDGSAAVLSDVRGIASMERDGVAYQAQNGTILRSGDKLTCDAGTVATITVGESRLVLGEKAAVEIRDASVGSFSLFVQAGEIFTDARSPLQLHFGEDRTLTMNDSVSQLSIRTGTQTISVFRGAVEDTRAGHQTDWLEGETTSREMPIDSLNAFTIGQLRLSNKAAETCFSNQALDKLEENRRIQMQEQLNNTNPTISLEGEIETTSPAETQPEASTEAATEPTASTQTTQATDATEPAGTTAPAETQPETTAPAETQPETTAPAETQPETTAPETQPTEPTKYVTLTIRCDTILDNWDDLDPAKAPYVPADGVILYPVQVAFTEGETVFDVLKRACDAYGIQMESSWSPMYGSAYVEGINNLYEFDCGAQSGWMYKVNEWFPNYGCSAYTLKEGDDIVWCYTCKGLGEDVGGSVY